MEELNRRDLVKGAAVAGLAVMGAGVASANEDKKGEDGALASERACPYVSAFTAGKLVQAAGKPADARKVLEEALKEKKIDVQVALKGLPEGEKGDIEAVSRLISLARGNGYCVELRDTRPGKVAFRISMPKSINMLQSGHHITSN